MKDRDLNAPDDRDELYELLCAHLLGETTTEEAARVESALAEREDLRAERARLEATMALVRDHAGPGESGADERVERIAAAARGQGDVGTEARGGASSGPAAGSTGPRTAPVLPFHRRPAFRIAAGFVGLASAGLLGVYAWNGGFAGREAGGAPFGYDLGFGGAPAPETVARLELAGDDPYLDRAREQLETVRQLGALGYGGGGASAPATESEVQDYAANLRRLDEAPESLDAETVAQLKSLGSLSSGQARSAAPAEAAGDVAFEGRAFNDVVGVGGGAGGGGGKIGGRRAGRARETSVNSIGGPATGGPGSGGTMPPPPSGVGTSSGDLSFLADSTVAFEEPYRGPGDTAPPQRDLLGPMDLEPPASVAEPVEDLDARLVQIGYVVDGPDLNSLPSGDDLLLQELLDSLDLGREALPDLLEGLGYLPTGYTGNLTDATGREAIGRLVEAKRAELEQARIERQLQTLLEDCRRRPGESLRDMFFRHWGQRPFVPTASDPLSTFSADVDTASYALARRMLLEGTLPTRAQIRTEEFVNYFDADLEAPLEETFAIQTDLGPAEFAPSGSGTWMLRVGVAGKAVSDAERRPLSLTFVVDTSGSMRNGGRLELVKGSLRQLLGKLDSRDELAIVRFSSSASVVLPRTNASNRGVIEAAIASLEPKGSTNVEQGLNLGYDLASEALREDAMNRVVFLSDGVGNVGETDQARLVDQVADRRAKGIYLNTIGFGVENHNDVFLEQLANRGDGLCNYVDSALEARRALVENFTGTFETIARDVKLQVEFDPSRVERYRLLGYENRAIADREFTNDAVDAGEIGAGHTVVALYELEGVDLSEGAGPLATVRVRYKPPFEAGFDRDADEWEPPADEVARQIEAVVTADQALWSFEALPSGFAAAQCAAQLAEVLRRSAFTRGDSMRALEERTLWVADRLEDEAFREFAAIVSANRAALEALVQPASDTQAHLDALKYLRYELERERSAEGTPDPVRLADLEARVAAEEQALEQAMRTRER